MSVSSTCKENVIDIGLGSGECIDVLRGVRMVHKSTSRAWKRDVIRRVFVAGLRVRWARSLASRLRAFTSCAGQRLPALQWDVAQDQ